MTNKELDARIGECSIAVAQLVADLSACEPNIDQAVALGALSAASTILSQLHTTTTTAFALQGEVIAPSDPTLS